MVGETTNPAYEGEDELGECTLLGNICDHKVIPFLLVEAWVTAQVVYLDTPVNQ